MRRKVKFLSFVLVGLLGLDFISPAVASIQCLDPDKQPVDWWVVLKLPLIKSDSLTNDGNSGTTDGESFIYIDPNQEKNFFDTKAISSNDQPIANTLNQIYKSTGINESWVMYNDQPPNSSYYSFTRGHTKGVLAYDDSTGFWLIQSTPKFPPPQNAEYAYSGSPKNGQGMLCISLPATSFNDIGAQFNYSFPRFYSGHFHNDSAKILKDIYNLSRNTSLKEKTTPKPNPEFNQHIYTSLNGTVFKSYVQTNTAIDKDSGRKNPDFYACVANDEPDICNGGFQKPLKHGLFVQSWLTSGTLEGQVCNLIYRVNDADAYALNVKTDEDKTYIWQSLHDHSKWAISTASGSEIVCFGDLNRTDEQRRRGGGIVCFENKRVHDLMDKMITKTIPCQASSD